MAYFISRKLENCYAVRLKSQIELCYNRSALKYPYFSGKEQ